MRETGLRLGMITLAAGCVTLPTSSASAQQLYSRTSQPMVDLSGLPPVHFHKSPLQADLIDERLILHTHPQQAENGACIDGMHLPLPEKHVAARNLIGPYDLRNDMPMVCGLKQLPQAGPQSYMQSLSPVRSGLPRGQTTRGLQAKLAGWAVPPATGPTSSGSRPARQPAATSVNRPARTLMEPATGAAGAASGYHQEARTTVSAKLQKLLKQVPDR